MTPSPAFLHPVELRRRAALGPDAVARADHELTSATPAEIVAWACQRFGQRLVLTASFADTTLIDIATRVDPDIEVVFLDTGLHFAETLTTVRRAMERYRLNLTVLRPEPTAIDLWELGIEACCKVRKVAPLDRYLAGRADAWLGGLRRADHPSRADAPIVSIDRRGLVKINPLAAMTDVEHDAYVEAHGVLVNALHLDGYGSIGCWPCTEPSTEGRAGRWADSGKTECGLHR